MMKKINLQSGFTLVEMLTAVTILVVGVLGPLNIATRGITDGIYAKNQIAANFLAQEAMETVINRRNSNLKLPGTDWLAGIEDGTVKCISSGPCYADATDPDLISGENFGGNTTDTGLLNDDFSPPHDAFNLQFCSNSNLYQRLNDTCTNRIGPVFTRRIFVTTVTAGREVKVEVIVEWDNKNQHKTLNLISHLYKNS